MHGHPTSIFWDTPPSSFPLRPSPQQKMAEEMTDLRVLGYEAILQPNVLRSELPLSTNAKEMISKSRLAIHDILEAKSDKILVIVGPCSIHNVDEALEYAHLLLQQQPLFPDLVLVMRTYFEKVSIFILPSYVGTHKR